MNLVTPQKLAATIVQQSVSQTTLRGDHIRYMKQVVKRSETRINTAVFGFSSITHGTNVVRVGGRFFLIETGLGKIK